MAARAISESSDSSEQNSSDESDFYDVNLYDSDVAETSEPSEDTGPRPVTSLAEFNEMMDNNNSKAVKTKPKVRRIFLATQTGNFFCVCDLNRISYTCTTEHPGFQSTCLDVWVLETAYYAYRQQHGTDSHRGHEYVY